MPFGKHISMPKRKNNYKINDEQFIESIKTSISMREAIHKLGLCSTGSAFRIFKKRAQALSIDTSHLLGKAHLTGKTNQWVPKRPLEEILVADSDYNSIARLKIRLIKNEMLDNKCYECNLPPIWNNKPLALQLDHINGIHNDHRLENLRLLCPNCHSQTTTFAGKNIGGLGGT